MPDGGIIDGYEIVFYSESTAVPSSIKLSYPDGGLSVNNRYLTLRLTVSSGLKGYIDEGSRVPGNYIKMIIFILRIKSSYGIGAGQTVGRLPVVDPDNLITGAPLSVTQTVRVVNMTQSDVINYYRSDNGKMMELKDIYKLSSVEFTTL